MSRENLNLSRSSLMEDDRGSRGSRGSLGLSRWTTEENLSVSSGSRELLNLSGSRELLNLSGSREVIDPVGSREVLNVSGSREVLNVSSSGEALNLAEAEIRKTTRDTRKKSRLAGWLAVKNVVGLVL